MCQPPPGLPVIFHVNIPSPSLYVYLLLISDVDALTPKMLKTVNHENDFISQESGTSHLMY